MSAISEKEQAIRKIIDNIDWDLWREQYNNLTFDDQRRIYDELLPKFPQQEGYDAAFFLHVFQRLQMAGFALEVMKVSELGPFRGELAGICLKQFKLRAWAGYEISRWAVERTRPDAKKLGFYNIAIGNQFWDMDLPCFDIFVSSDTIEHFTDEDAKKIFDTACVRADILMLQIDCKPKGASWRGYDGTHIIEMTTEDIIEYLSSKGFVLVERSGIRIFLVSKMAAQSFPKIFDHAGPEKKNIPIKEGFRFECQKCGVCCRQNWEVLLCEEEITVLKEHGIPIHFKKIVKKLPNFDKPQTAIVPLLPKIDGRCFCQDEDKNLCLIHSFRPMACFRAPFVTYTYRQRPSLEEMRTLMNDPDMTEVEADKFITEEPFEFGGKKLCVYSVAAASVFLNDGSKCPGIGKGNPWTELEVHSYVKRYGPIFEEHMRDITAVIRKYRESFAADFDKHFEMVDENRQIYQARKRSWSDIIGG
jgi:Fe-S-cluster containining protein